MTIKTMAFDVECYVDYFLLKFKDVDTGEVIEFELYDGEELECGRIEGIFRHCRVVSFNGKSYDIPIIMLALTGACNAELKRASDSIIIGQIRSWEFERQRGLTPIIGLNHIDLIEVAPGKGSLKIYGGRLHSKRIQDLPIEPNASISPAQRAELRAYCGNDLDTTIDLFRFLGPQIDLRERMTAKTAIDLRSKSDAQIAEAVIKKRVEKVLGDYLQKSAPQNGKTFHYKPTPFVWFSTPPLRAMYEKLLASPFVVSAEGKVDLPEWLAKDKITIGTSIYRMGIGGLHSSEETVAHFTDADNILVDRDVASYYPAIILNLGLHPTQMGEAFLGVYRGIVKARLEAKHRGDKVTADALKICINGSFGKFGSKWSYLYSPDLLIQTTITGQLSLLMLIEMLETHDIPVVSANTDGIVIKCPRSKIATMDAVVGLWENETGFDTEATFYDALYSRDINNYVAVKKDGTKTKGAYAHAGLQKNPTNEICIDAILAYLTEGVPLETTVWCCNDIKKFVTVRACTGGAVKDGVVLGKAVRWYYAVGETGTINYKSNGNTVARSLGAKPLMQLPDEMPSDVDYAWYVNEATSILEDIGAIPRRPVVKKTRKKKSDA